MFAQKRGGTNRYRTLEVTDNLLFGVTECEELTAVYMLNQCDQMSKTPYE